jgi:hypothetical protein
MASSYTDLGIEKMATGENAGTWGTKTNTNLDIIEKSIAGYVEQAVQMVMQQNQHQLQDTLL